MRVLVTGASGLIGRSVVKALVQKGHDVVAMTRAAGRVSKGQRIRVLEADPTAPGPWQKVAAECDAAVTLAGAHIGTHRWTVERKGLLRSSRLRSTLNLVDAWAREPRARILLASSATHYYGPRPPEELLAETAKPGDTFLARLMRDWEDEANHATRSGARVVNLRMGIVLGHGGALDYCIPMAKAFLGHMRGAARSTCPWIHEEDNVGLMLHALERGDLHGPLNMTAPGIVTWAGFMSTLARQLGRPFTVPVPRWAALLVAGEAATLWFSGQSVDAARARATGYGFKYDVVRPALADVLSRHPWSSG